MNNQSTTSFYSDKVFQKMLQLIYQYRYCVLGAFFFGFLAYLFTFTNKLPNHDDVYWFFTKGATVQSGRWGLIPLSIIFPDYSMPWIYGVLSLALLAVGICLIIRIFNISTSILQFLLAGIIITFPSQICTFTYMFTACAYALSFLLSVLSVYLFRLGKKTYYFLAVLSLVYSLSIYQAYISIAVSLFILLAIYDLLSEQVDPGKLIVTGIHYIVFLIVSLGTYWVTTKLLWTITDTGMGDYANFAFNFSLLNILESIESAYIDFFDTFRHGYDGLIPTFLSRYIHYFIILMTGMELLLWIYRNKKLSNFLLLLLLIILFPLGINCMYIFINPGAIHTLVLLSYTSIYILFCIVIECGNVRISSNRYLQALKTLAYESIILGMFAITFTNVYIANEAYLNMYLSYENTYSITSTIITQVQNIPDYSTESKIAIIGSHSKPNYYTTYFSRLDPLMGATGISPTTYSIEYFWEYYNGFPIKCASDEEALRITQSTEFQSMPSYPNYGYVKKINDIIVVKFSNP